MTPSVSGRHKPGTCPLQQLRQNLRFEGGVLAHQHLTWQGKEMFLLLILWALTRKSRWDGKIFKFMWWNAAFTWISLNHSFQASAAFSKLQLLTARWGRQIRMLLDKLNEECVPICSNVNWGTSSETLCWVAFQADGQEIRRDETRLLEAILHPLAATAARILQVLKWKSTCFAHTFDGCWKLAKWQWREMREVVIYMPTRKAHRIQIQFHFQYKFFGGQWSGQISTPSFPQTCQRRATRTMALSTAKAEDLLQHLACNTS